MSLTWIPANYAATVQIDPTTGNGGTTGGISPVIVFDDLEGSTNVASLSFPELFARQGA